MKKFILLILLVLTAAGCTSFSPPGSLPNTITPIQQPATYCGKSTSAGTQVSNFLSTMFYFVMTPIKFQMQSISALIFDNIAGESPFRNTIRIMLVLYVAIYGMMFMFGIVEANASDLVGRLVKIGILLTLTTSTAYAFFTTHLFNLFTNGSDQLIDIVSNPYCADGASEANIFSFTAYAINSLFTLEIFLRLSALLFAFPVGWLCLAVFFLAMLKYCMAILKAMLAYILAFTAVMFLIALAPIFISLLLFDETRDFFKIGGNFSCLLHCSQS